MSYTPEVIADHTEVWTGNGLRFETAAEALSWVEDLSFRWTAVRDTRVVESADPVNYKLVNGKLEQVRAP